MIRAILRLPRRSTFVRALLLFSIALAIPAASTTAEPDSVLTPGKGVFWNGPDYVGNPVITPTTAIPPACASSGGTEYQLKLAPGSSNRNLRLRAALDSVLPNVNNYVRPYSDGRPGAGNKFRLELTDPDGNCISGENSSSIGLGHGYSVELVLEKPKQGTWKIRVLPVEVKDLSFRLRAKLEKVAAPPGEDTILKPNLRIVPPFEITFQTPTVTYGPGSPESAGVPQGCMAEEVEERLFAGQGAITGRCLRFSAGVENVGAGPLVINAQFGLSPMPAWQRLYVWQADGTHRYEDLGSPDNPSAGEFETHPAHAHDHYEGIYTYELFEVTDAQAGTLKRTGDGQKRGFAPGDERLADWERFYQCPQIAGTLNDTVPAPCSYSSSDGFTVLGTGWADIYEWNRGGQYVDFPANPANVVTPKPGRYIIRGTADTLGKLIESNEHDNVSYTYFEVQWHSVHGETITILERGYGRDPWDPQKIVLTTLP